MNKMTDEAYWGIDITYLYWDMGSYVGRLIRESVVWFQDPAIKVSLGKLLNPKLLPVAPPSMHVFFVFLKFNSIKLYTVCKTLTVWCIVVFSPVSVCLRYYIIITEQILEGCGSVVEPASCYWKVAGSIPLICMSKRPWARYWTPNYSWCSAWHLAWQPPSQCMSELLWVALDKSIW